MEYAAPGKRIWTLRLGREGDASLVERIAAGERDALSELYTRYQRPLFQYLLQLTSDRGVAEEILQDTLVAAWKSASSFAGRSSVRTWLFGIARRQAHNTLRGMALPLAAETELETAASTEPEPEGSLLAGAEREALAQAMEGLSAIHREALVLAFVHELSYQELADVLDVPIGTVRSRLSNAKKALRGILESARE